MFARVFALLPLALLASASHLEARDSCNTGPIQCCKSTQTVQQSNGLLDQLGLAGVAAVAEGLIGLNCVSIIGNSCVASQQPVCCKNNEFNGLVNAGCSPINLNV